MGFFKKNFNGVTNKTVENLVLNAGAFFVNFDVENDTYETAKASGKLIGATRGGGEFSAKQIIRQIEIDGTLGRTSGLAMIDGWDVSLKATVLDVTEGSIKAMLASVTVTEETSHHKIVGKNEINVTDYLTNVTWVGNISGSTEPIIIQVYNAFNEDGFTLSVADKSESAVACTFWGYNKFDDFLTDTITPPFAIYLPIIGDSNDGGAEDGE